METKGNDFSKFGYYFYYLIKWVFRIGLIVTLILLIAEIAREGFLSFYFNLNFLLILVFVTGVISLLSFEGKEFKEREKEVLSKKQRVVLAILTCFLGIFFLGWVFQYNLSSKVSFTFRGLKGYINEGRIFFSDGLLNNLSAFSISEDTFLTLSTLDEVKSETKGEETYEEKTNFEIPKGAKMITFKLKNVGFFDKFKVNLSGMNKDSVTWTAGIAGVGADACEVTGGGTRGFKGGTFLKLGEDEYYYVVQNRLIIRRIDMDIPEIKDFVLASDIVSLPENYDLKDYEKGEVVVDIKEMMHGVFASIEKDGQVYKYYLDGDTKRYIPDDIYERFYKEHKFPLIKNQEWLIGLGDGVLKYPLETLFNVDGGVYVVSEWDRWMKIGRPEVFSGKGYKWEDLEKIHPEKIGWYQQTEIADKVSSNFAGEIIYLEDRDEYYYKEICGYSKILKGEEVINSYLPFIRFVRKTNSEEMEQNGIKVPTIYNQDAKELVVDRGYLEDQKDYLFYVIFEEPLSENVKVDKLEVIGYRENFLKRILTKLKLE
jgi:hypothetical protein